MPFGCVLGRRGRQSFVSQSKPAPEPESIPLDVLVDEERIRGYKPENFYPANPGDVLEGRYKLKAKIGWGSSSTVWLAHDISREKGMRPNRYVAIKICSCNIVDDDLRYELDMTIHVSSVNSQHRGGGILGTAIESFGLDSPQGPTHLALVFEPMREPLWLFRRRFVDKDDLNLANIMVSFEDPSVIEAFVQGQVKHPMARKRVGTRTVYRCHNDFGGIDGIEALKNIIPKITDLGLAQRGDRPGPLLHPIQPDNCPAPEVLLGTGWTYSADIWHFGIMVWDLLTGRTLFEQGDRHSYSAVQRLADMVALLGPIPPVLIQREKAMRCWRWEPQVVNPSGQLCGSAAEFFGGPFFTDDGTFIGNHLVPQPRIWENEMPGCIPKEEADCFFKFMRRMLCWLPEERPTAKELKSDPWLGEPL